MGLAGGERAHEDAVGAEGVEADAVAEQGAAGLSLGGVDREDRDCAVRVVGEESQHQLVGQRGLAGAAGAGDAEHGGGGRALGRVDGQALLDAGDGAGDRHPAVGGGSEGPGGVHLRGVEVGALDHVRDHAVEAHRAAVFWGEDLGDAVVLELLDLARHDHSAATAVDLDVLCAALLEEVDHVLEELDVAALVGRDRDALDVLLDRGVDNLFDRAVVAEMDHLGPLRLQDAAHDVDGHVVTVKQRCRGHETHLVFGLIAVRCCHWPSRSGFRLMIAGRGVGAGETARPVCHPERRWSEATP